MMKKLLLAALLFPALAFSQERGDTKIIVKVKDTTNLVNRLCLALYEGGYDIHTKDLAVGFISTEEKKFTIAWMLKGRFLIKGNTLVITGQVGSISTADKRIDYDPLEYKGLSISLSKGAWKELEYIGRQFGTLTYSK